MHSLCLGQFVTSIFRGRIYHAPNTRDETDLFFCDSDAESCQRRFEIKVIRNVKNLGFSPPKII